MVEDDTGTLPNVVNTFFILDAKIKKETNTRSPSLTQYNSLLTFAGFNAHS